MSLQWNLSACRRTTRYSGKILVACGFSLALLSCPDPACRLNAVIHVVGSDGAAVTPAEVALDRQCCDSIGGRSNTACVYTTTEGGVSVEVDSEVESCSVEVSADGFVTATQGFSLSRVRCNETIEVEVILERTGE